MSTWQVIVDIGMVAAIALIIFISIKRGFIKSFFKSTKLLIVIIITALIGSLFVGVFEKHVVSGFVEGKITNVLVQTAEGHSGTLDFDKLLDSIPSVAKNLIPVEKLETYFNSLTGSNVEIATKVGEKIEGIAINIMSKFLAYIATFVAVFILVSIAIIFLEKIGELPILSSFNRLFGCVWGIGYAYMFASIAVFVVLLIFGNDFIEETYITRFIYRLGLFTH